MNKPKSYEDLRLELGYIRDNLIDAIRNGMQEGVRQGLFIYEELARVFINKLVQLGATYDKKRALKEEINFLGGWNEVQWLHDDLKDFINEVFLQKNFEIMRRIIYFPTKLARISLEARDFYTYHRFIGIYAYIYNNLDKIGDKENKEAVFEKCRRFLKEFSTFYLSYYEIEQALNEKAVIEIKDYAEYILKILSSMMKIAFENKNVAHLQLLIMLQNKLFVLSSYSDYGDDIRMLESELKRERDATLRKDIESEMNIKKALKDFYERISMLKKLTLFGLNAWIVHNYNQDKLSKDDFKTYHDILVGNISIEELISIFSAAREDINEEVLGWQWWELSDSEEGEVVTMQFDSFLNELFCLKLLEIIDNMQAERINDIFLNEDVPIHLIEKEDSALPKIISNITGSREKWDGIILNFKRDEALQIFTRTRDRMREARVRQIIDAELDYGIISEFSEAVSSSWNEKTIFRKLFRPKNVGDPPSGQFYIGFNQLERKEFYVANSGFGMAEVGEHYGRQLASAEDADITKKLWDSLSSVPDIEMTNDNIISVLTKAIERLKNEGFKKLLIIALNSWLIADQIEGAEAYDSNEKSYRGFPFRKINVSTIKGKERNSILIVDINSIASWSQYKPKLLFEEDEKYYGDLCIMIKKIDEEYAREIIMKDRDTFLRDSEGRIRTEEEAIEYLEQKVHLRILEQYKFEIANLRAGIKIPLKQVFGIQSSQ